MPNSSQRTLVLIKPDAVRRGLVGDVLGRFERKGLSIAAMDLRTIDGELADRHYAEHVERDFYPPLREFVTSGPLVAMVLEGDQAVDVVRALNGATDGRQAAPGSIRGDLSLSNRENLVHGSDSAESASREIALFFPISAETAMPASTTVLLATCAEVPDGDADEQLGLAALHHAGLQTSFAVWDDPAVDWADADLVVVRSTWDYPVRRSDFLAWARSVPRLANPADVLAWNSDKTYLRQLADAGVPVVPTTWYAPGDSPGTPDGETVVKPTVSAGARDTRRHPNGAAAHTHMVELLDAGRPVMVQPYLDAVDTAGETGLVWMADRFSHAFRKGPLLAAGAGATAELFAAEDIVAREPSAAERDTAERVLDLLVQVAPAGRERLLYARVDLVPGPDGEPLLLELELVEPSLWFAADPDAPARWARALVARLADG